MRSANRLVLGSACPACGSVLGPLCGDCARSISPAGDPSVPGLDLVLTPWEYGGAARSLVLALKLRGVRSASGPLGDACARAIRAAGVRPRTIAWVPGRRRDRRRRGFDHAEEIARHVSLAIGLPVAGLLARSRPVADQASLGAAKRAGNLSGAFRARPCAGTVLLVDDLVTTGATMRACAAALTDAGADGVIGVAPCRSS